MSKRSVPLLLVLLTGSVLCGCERDTKLTIEGGNPPQFRMSGSGWLGRLVVRGHKTLRQIDGPDASACWYIEAGDEMRGVSKLSPIIYGKIPEGCVQKYPENGPAPALSEGETYYVQIDTTNANGTSKYFIIQNGMVRFADYESELGAVAPSGEGKRESARNTMVLPGRNTAAIDCLTGIQNGE
jgi:hypothetical protein